MMREGESKRLLLPASMRGWAVSVKVQGTPVSLGSIPLAGRAIGPILTPPSPGTYVVTMLGPKAAKRVVSLVVIAG